MDLQSAGLLVAIITLLVACLAAALAFRQLQRWDHAHREDRRRQEDDDILEWARNMRRDVTTPILSRIEPIPDEWRREWRERKSQRTL